MIKTITCKKENDYGKMLSGISPETGKYIDVSEYRLRVKSTGELLEPSYMSYMEAKKDLKYQADYYLYLYESLEVVARQPVSGKW